MNDAEQFYRFLDQPVLQIGQNSFSLGTVLALVGDILAALIVGWIVFAVRNGKRRTALEAAALERAREAETRMAELVASQNELTGRMQTMSEIFSTRQGDMMRVVNEPLEGMSGRIGQSITETTRACSHHVNSQPTALKKFRHSIGVNIWQTSPIAFQTSSKVLAPAFLR